MTKLLTSVILVLPQVSHEAFLIFKDLGLVFPNHGLSLWLGLLIILLINLVDFDRRPSGNLMHAAL